ncbi:MAG: hypothetical protein GY757_03880, partial [bacterium]|nr:hypothetical protein [bacterium]
DIETREIQAYLLDLTQGTAATVHGRSGAPAISPPPSAALPNSWIPSVAGNMPNCRAFTKRHTETMPGEMVGICHHGGTGTEPTR